MSLLLIVSTLLLIFKSNAISIISDIWTDDFAYDINGINGWDDNNIINGTSKLYHGWYSGTDDDPPSLSRSFQCNQPSLIQLSFTIYFGCNIESTDALIISFDGEAKENIIWDNLRNTPQIFDVDEPIADATCSTTPSIGFKGSNQSMTISEKPIRESTTFVIKFEFILSSGVESEFEGISDIKIQCIPATSPTPAIHPTIASTQIQEDAQEPLLNETIEKIIIAILCTLIGLICGVRITVYIMLIIRRKKDSMEQIENNNTSRTYDDITADTPSSGMVNEISDGFGFETNDINTKSFQLNRIVSDDSDDMYQHNANDGRNEETPNRVELVVGHANLMVTRRASEISTCPN